MKIKVGNSVDLVFSVKDSAGNLVQNLSEALAVKFMVKINQLDADSAAKISKNLTNGITVDDPVTGNIRVSLTSLNTTIPAGRYYAALQIEWIDHIQEVSIKENATDAMEMNTINFMQDVIR